MAITGFPWFKVYASETLSDENFTSMTLEERGAWITLLCHCWKEGSIPSDQDKLSRLCGFNARAMPEQWSTLWSGIASRFKLTPGGSRLVSPRLEEERQKSLDDALAKSAHGRKGAEAKWGRYKKEMPEHCPSYAQPMPKDAPKPKPKERNTTAGKKSVNGHSPLDIPSTPQEAIDLGKRLCALWPSQDPSGRIIKKDSTLLVMRLVEINTRQPLYSWAILEDAAKAYLAADRSTLKAPQYFFSTSPDKNYDDKPPFKMYADAAFAKASAMPEPSHA